LNKKSVIRPESLQLEWISAAEGTNEIPMPTIRLAKPSDAERLAEIVERIFQDIVGSTTPNA
jgi:hypothetical protein